MQRTLRSQNRSPNGDARRTSKHPNRRIKAQRARIFDGSVAVIMSHAFPSFAFWAAPPLPRAQRVWSARLRQSFVVRVLRQAAWWSRCRLSARAVSGVDACDDCASVVFRLACRPALGTSQPPKGAECAERESARAKTPAAATTCRCLTTHHALQTDVPPVVLVWPAAGFSFFRPDGELLCQLRHRPSCGHCDWHE